MLTGKSLLCAFGKFGLILQGNHVDGHLVTRTALCLQEGLCNGYQVHRPAKGLRPCLLRDAFLGEAEVRQRDVPASEQGSLHRHRERGHIHHNTTL